MLLWALTIFSCATVSEPVSNDSDGFTGDANQSESEGSSAETNDLTGFDGAQGAIVTADCMFADYTYAIDILLSCGSERFADELRLHTFKRHSHSHQQVFNDQLLTYRNQQLWFDAYSTPRCIQIDNNGRLQLTTQPSQCTTIELIEQGNGFLLKDAEGGECATLGTSQCSEHQWTGGRECGGIDHRFLPLVMGDCSFGLQFTFETRAESCNGEYPEEECF